MGGGRNLISGSDHRPLCYLTRLFGPRGFAYSANDGRRASTPPRLVALLAAVRFYLLVQGDTRVLMSGITMRQMPGAAIFAPIHPQLRSAFDKALIGGVLRLGLVMVHDLVRGGTAFRSEVMHSNTTV